jgi:hypothetical protein
MMGDLLLSAPFASENFCIPTRDGKLVFSPNAKKVPFSLRQKLVVIDDNLVIGWAGDAGPAKDVITGLREKNESDRLTRESFAEYFNLLDDSIKKRNTAFLGFFIESNQLFPFHVKCNHLLTEHIGEIAVIGSGAESVINYVQNVSVLPAPPTDSFVVPAVLTMMGISGSLLSSEIQSDASLRNLFGGGYEIATIVGDGFRKIEDITYLFWNAEITGSRVDISYPHRSFQISYIDDCLLIRVDSMKKDGGVTIYPVAPIYKYLDIDDFVGLVPSSLNSKFICHYFSFRDLHGQNVILLRAEYVGQDGPTFVRFMEDGWKPKQFAVNKDQLEQVSELILRQFSL